jgi:tRNA-specific 2-thiouridylase
MTPTERLTLLREHGFSVSEAELAANTQKTVAVGMSGGVDSSVAALLIQLLGYKTIGVFMKNWEEAPDATGVCPSETDWKDARRVADQLSIPVFSVNFSEQYRAQVFEGFLRDYRAGLTPNPDILCNREIKFKVFADYTKLLGADYLATGHYCRVEQTPSGPRLLKGVDAGKDQTYFLHAVNGKALEHVLFPVGHLPKSQVRALAARFNLATQEKKDSTGVCFIGERDFKLFLSQYIESSKGDFVDLNGKKLGLHDGACFYTLGQRKGLGVGGPGGPWFVAKKDQGTNQVTLVEGESHPALYCDGLMAQEATWIGTEPMFPLRATAKVRYRQTDQPCVVEKHGELLKVTFDNPQRSVTAGQSVVFYAGETCLGGALIHEPGPSYHQLGLAVPGVSEGI